VTTAGRRSARTLHGALVRLGFTDPARAATLLESGPVHDAVGPVDDDAPILEALGRVASPDDALLSVTRLLENSRGAEHDRVCRVLRTPGPVRDRLLALLGASTALGDHLVRHPEDVCALEPDDLLGDEGQVRAELLAAVGAGDGDRPGRRRRDAARLPAQAGDGRRV
jgi:glutamate-ammonia-ligase adenylyltransferase